MTNTSPGTAAHAAKEFFPAEDGIPAQHRISASIEQDTYLVDGKLKKWEGARQDVFSPIMVHTHSGISQKRLGSYPLLGAAESLEALDAAMKAYGNGSGHWPTLPVEKRIAHVEKFLGMMAHKRDEVINLLMWEIGKSYKDSAKEFDRTVEYVKDTIGALKDLDRASSRFTIEQGIIGQIRRSPLGVALCMGPFNYPLNETYTTLIPALIMGNTVVFKPAKYGVLLHQPLMEAYKESFPPGVINTIYGDGATVIGPLIASGKIDVLAFIGTAKVANILKKQHPRANRLRSVLGLDAKNPAIVLNDADLGTAVDECAQGALSYNGQRCTALKILFVQEGIYDRFVVKLSEKVDSLKGGMPWDKDVSITPLAETGKTAYLAELVQDAVSKGAMVANDGGQSNGTFFRPAVVSHVTKDMKLYSVEQFGPVIPVVSFKDISEPLEYIAASEYGQQVSIFGSSPDRIARLIDPLANQVSRVNINSQCQRGPDTFPFTGRKNSAEGTLSTTDALRVFSIRSLVAAKYIDANREIIKDIVRGGKSHFLSDDYIF